VDGRNELLQRMDALWQTAHSSQMGLRLVNGTALCCQSCSQGYTTCKPAVSLIGWGSIINPISQKCLSVPFTTDCNKTTTANYTSSLNLLNICPAEICANDIVRQNTTLDSLYSSIDNNTYFVQYRGGEIFRTTMDPGITYERPKLVHITSWRDHSAYLLCGDGSVWDNVTGLNYRTLQLHRGTIWVRQIKSGGCPNPMALKRVRYPFTAG